MVAMYWPGFEVKMEISLDPKAPCFLSSSMRSLLDETNAISIPEKNAENTREINMMTRLCTRLSGLGSFAHTPSEHIHGSSDECNDKKYDAFPESCRYAFMDNCPKAEYDHCQPEDLKYSVSSFIHPLI